MIDFIVGKMGFWAVTFFLSLLGVIGTGSLLFSKLVERIPKWLIRLTYRFFCIAGIASLILFLVALTIRAW